MTQWQAPNGTRFTIVGTEVEVVGKRVATAGSGFAHGAWANASDLLAFAEHARQLVTAPATPTPAPAEPNPELEALREQNRVLSAQVQTQRDMIGGWQKATGYSYPQDYLEAKAKARSRGKR